jgi:hypothetical protein
MRFFGKLRQLRFGHDDAFLYQYVAIVLGWLVITANYLKKTAVEIMGKNDAGGNEATQNQVK